MVADRSRLSEAALAYLSKNLFVNTILRLTSRHSVARVAPALHPATTSIMAWPLGKLLSAAEVPCGTISGRKEKRPFRGLGFGSPVSAREQVDARV
jgi:hypothetical protein